MAEVNSAGKEIGTLSLALNMVNIVIGAGIFIIPPVVASMLGSSAIFAYLACGVLVLGIVTTFAIIGSKLTKEQNLNQIVGKVFGPYIAYIVNVLLWFGTGVIMNAALVNALADMLHIQDTSLRFGFIVSLVSVIALVNIRGVKYGNGLVVFNTLIKLLPMILLIIVGLFFMNFQNIIIDKIPSFDEIGKASLLLFFAFGGAESILNLGGEVKNPESTMTKGLLLGFALIMILYCGIQSVCQGVLGADLINHTASPLADTAEIMGGNLAKKILLFAAAFSIYASLSGALLAYPRGILSSADAREIPSYFGKIHPKFKTPYVAILIYAILVILFSTTGSFASLAVISSGSLLIIYLVILVSFMTDKDFNLQTSKTYFTKGLALISTIGVLILLSKLKYEEAFTLFKFIAVASVLYFINKYFLSKNKSV